MNTCYKCGRELESGNECEHGCASANQPSDEQVLRILDAMRKQRVEVDWDKIATLEDLLIVFKTIFGGACVLRGTPAYETLKRFLKEPQ